MKIFNFILPILRFTSFNIVDPVTPTLLATLGPSAIAAGGSLIGGLLSGIGAERGAKRERKTRKEELAESKRQFDLELELAKLKEEQRKEEAERTASQAGLAFLAKRRDVLSGQIRNRRFRGSLMKALRGATGGGGGTPAASPAPSVGLPI